MNENERQSYLVHDAQDLLFEKFQSLINILLRIFTEKMPDGMSQFKSLDALKIFVQQVFYVGYDIHVVSRERAKLEFLSGIDLLESQSQKKAFEAFIVKLLGHDGADVNFANYPHSDN